MLDSHLDGYTGRKIHSREHRHLGPRPTRGFGLVLGDVNETAI